MGVVSMEGGEMGKERVLGQWAYHKDMFAVKVCTVHTL